MSRKIYLPTLGVWEDVDDATLLKDVPRVSSEGILINPATGLPIAPAAPVMQAHGLTDASSVAVIGPTWMERRTVEHPFSSVGIFMQNPTAFPVTIQAIAAVTDRYSSTIGAAPTAADLLASTQKYYRLTFDGAATVTLAAASGADNEVQPFAFSDMTPLASIPRVDIPGALPLIDVWVYVTSAGGTTAFQVARGTEWSAGINLGGKTRCAFVCRKTNTKIIDLTSEGALPTNYASMNNAAQIDTSPIAGVITTPIYPVSEVLVSGDSKAAGSLVSLQYMGVSAHVRAVWSLNDDGGRYSIANIARGAWPSWDYFARLLAHLNAKDSNGDYLHNPAVVVYHAWSPNDITQGGGTVTDALVDAMWARCSRLITLCRRRNIGLVLCTGSPRATNGANTASSYTSPEDAIRQSFNDRLRAITGPRLAIADTGGSAVGNGATPELWASANLTQDGLHESQAGYALQAPLIAAAIQAVF